MLSQSFHNFGVNLVIVVSGLWSLHALGWHAAGHDELILIHG